MSIATTLPSSKNVSVCWLLAFIVTAACTRKEAPELAPAAAPPPPPPPIVRDAAAGGVDGASDAGEASGGGKKGTGVPPTGGGGTLKVEGSLSRADSDKVVRAAQSKLRACYEQSNPKGSGQKGRVSYKMTVDDRGRVTVAEI